MGFADYSVLIVYFLVLIVIGVISSLRIKKQEDFFMGGRSFGKLLQTFAAFGAGTGSSDPVNTARTTFTSGVSGMWSVMYWLFVTPFYWITGVWYRRMRHLTLGDWFVERYESRTMGAAYCIFGISFFMLYGAMLFSAIGKVASPLMGIGADESFKLFGIVFDASNIEYLLVPVIGAFVLVYGILGGLRAAYFTDLIQGVCIILLSILLIPYGLDALVEKFGDASQSTMDGFRIMHERLPKASFSLVGSAGTSEFTLPLIIAVVMINLVGVVVQPHFIATRGGSAKTEMNARVGLVVGNFLKRFCTIGWMLTALIVLTLYSDNPTLLKDPDKTWGVASAELLGPGLTGLMLACLLAALMSSVDAYMIVGSGLVVRNIYAPFINPNATEKQCLLLGRLTGIIVVGGAVLIALSSMDVLALLKKTWVFPILFAAPFWIGMYWRRATTSAAWITVAFSTLAFFAIPFFAPMLAPDMRTNPSLLATNEMALSITTRTAAKTDVDRENAKNAEKIAKWKEQEATIQKMTDPVKKTAALEKLGDIPERKLLKEGDEFTRKKVLGGNSVFWLGGVLPVDKNGEPLKTPKLDLVHVVGAAHRVDDQTEKFSVRYKEGLEFKAFGNFRLDFLLYDAVGIDMKKLSSSTLQWLEFPSKIVLPFLVMIFFSLITPRNSKDALDRYYAKMKTPVDPDPEQDRKNLEESYKNPGKLESKKLFPGSSWEFQKPSVTDIVGFLLCVAVCFVIIGLVMLVARIGA